MAEHNDFFEKEFNHSKGEPLDQAIDFNELLNMASGFLNTSMTNQDLTPENDDGAIDPNFETTLIMDSESFDINDMFNIASQIMREPEFFENLSGLFNQANQEETAGELLSLPLNLPGILNMIGGLSNELNGLNTPSNIPQLEATILQELNEVREQIQELNGNLLDLKEELNNFIKRDKQDPNSLLEE